MCLVGLYQLTNVVENRSDRPGYSVPIEKDPDRIDEKFGGVWGSNKYGMGAAIAYIEDITNAFVTGRFGVL